MKIVVQITFILFLLFAKNTWAQTTLSRKEILAEIESITKNTNWINAGEASKASKRLEQLSRMLNNAPESSNNDEEDQTSDSANADQPFIDVDQIINGLNLAPGAEENNEIKTRTHQLIDDLYSTSINCGEYADLDLAKPVREAIIEEYKEDVEEYRHAGIYHETEIIVIDFSKPESLEIIPKLGDYKNVRTLVVTGGKNHCAPHNLKIILSGIRNMALEKLFIINFKNELTTLPTLILQDNTLKHLALLNNQLTSINPEIFRITSLEELYVDLNPIVTLSVDLTRLTRLKKLGIAKTALPANEIKKLEELLPHCKLLTE